ncbi:molybdopterin molybdotransferase MoeA [soil metagenome]
MISFPNARKRLLDKTKPLGVETVSLGKLGGRVFAEDLVCPFDVPHFDNSQFDGYAIRAADGLTPRRIVGTSAAGGPPSPPVGQGEAARIFTGAPLPEGADAVVMQEDVQADHAEVRVQESSEKGAFVRRRGEEIGAGTSFPVTGRVASPPLVGLAASFGQASFSVFRRPRVAVVATGSELVEVGNPLEPGQVYASNPWAITDALAGLGIVDVQSRLVNDDPARTRETFITALGDADVLITLGGVSVGDHDLVRSTLSELGVEETFWRVAMKPGKPFYFGMKEGKAVFGLPGNPVSALVTFQVLARPALRRMLGIEEAEEEITARLARRFTRKDTRYEFLRATLTDGVATLVEHQGSHMQTGLAFADALVHIPDGATSVEAGETVRTTPLRWGVR